MTGKTYKFTSLNQILNAINEDNVVALSELIKMSLVNYQKVTSEMRRQYPKETAGKLNTELGRYHIEWTDDGVNDFKPVIMIENDDTGELREINFTEQPS